MRDAQGRFESKKEKEREERESSGSFLIGLTTLRPRTLGRKCAEIDGKAFNLLYQKTQRDWKHKTKKENAGGGAPLHFFVFSLKTALLAYTTFFFF